MVLSQSPLTALGGYFSHRLRTVLQWPKRMRVANRLMGSLPAVMGVLMAAVR